MRRLTGVTSVLWLAGALLASVIDPSAADQAKPRAVLALFETTSVSLPQGPLPDGLRFVLYDDGQVIVRSNPTKADPDPPGRGVVFGRLSRDAAQVLYANASINLKRVAVVDSGVAALRDAGVTILEIWEGGRYRRFSAAVFPCQAEGRDFTTGMGRKVREQTDPQFLELCDRLLQFKIPTPQPWQPKAVQLRLGALDGAAERQIDWPKSWPPAPTDLKPKSAAAFCAPVSAEPGDFSNALVKARWGEIGRSALVIDAQRSSVIWDWYFDLPSEVPIVNEKGEIEHQVGNSCPQFGER